MWVADMHESFTLKNLGMAATQHFCATKQCSGDHVPLLSHGLLRSCTGSEGDSGDGQIERDGFCACVRNGIVVRAYLSLCTVPQENPHDFNHLRSPSTIIHIRAQDAHIQEGQGQQRCDSHSSSRTMTTLTGMLGHPVA